MYTRLLAILVLLVAACSDAEDAGPATTTAPATTGVAAVTTTTTTVAPTTSTSSTTTTRPETPEAAIARRYVEATLAGDAAEWRSLVSDTAVFRDGEDFIPLWEPLSEYAGSLTADFNGDGVQSLGDQLLRDVTLNGAHQARLEGLACTGRADRLECTVSATDVFYLTSGLLPRPWTLLLSLDADGLVQEIRHLERETNFADELAGLGRNAALLEYETWVFATHGTQYGALFGPSGPTYTAETIAVHARYIPEWSAQREDPRGTPAGNDAIVFQRTTALGPSLWRIGTGGSGLLPLVTFDRGRDPAWNPDRSLVAYEVDGDTPSIAIATADGTGSEVLLRGTDPAWMPDGSGIVYAAATDGGLADLYLLDLESGDSTRLTATSDVGEKTPDVASDGTIVFGAGQGDNSRCSILDTGTGAITPLEAPGAARCVWSPDGRSIAYYAFDAAGNADVWIVELPAGEPQRLTSDPGLDIAPAFSPDGAFVVYSSEAGNAARALNLWIIDLATGDGRQVTQSDSADVFADWG